MTGRLVLLAGALLALTMVWVQRFEPFMTAHDTKSHKNDRKKREALLHRIQRLMHDRVMFGPIFDPATLHGVGPRVEEPAIGLNAQLYFAAPYEDMRLKKQ